MNKITKYYKKCVRITQIFPLQPYFFCKCSCFISIKYELNYKIVLYLSLSLSLSLYIYINHFTPVTISTTVIWFLHIVLKPAVCRKWKELEIWGADQENISIQQYTYMFFQAMCIRV